MHRFRKGEAGYSLAELLVVVVIIGLAALVAVPSLGTFWRAYRIRSAADQLVSHLRVARQISVTQHVPVTFTINPSPANTYSFTYTIPGSPATVESFSLPKQVTVTNAPAAPLAFSIRMNGTVVNPTTPDDVNPTANFVRLSSPVGGGTIDQYTITFMAAGKVAVQFTR